MCSATLIFVVFHFSAIVLADSWFLLSAPWTPFHEDFTINLDRIKDVASFEQEMQTSAVWINGGLAQWIMPSKTMHWNPRAALSVAERKSLAEEWVLQGHDRNLNILVHCGAQCIEDAVDLAAHAESIGADGVTALPPFAPDKPADVKTLVDIIKRIAAAAPKTPFYYYHIPGVTGVDFKVLDFLTLASVEIPTLVGVKYVSDDFEDFSNCLQFMGGRFRMLWATEPKLSSMYAGPDSFVLAESYYAPYLRPALDLYAEGKFDEALAAQQKLNEIENMINRFHGEAVGAKAVMGMISPNLEMGSPRLPLQPLTVEERAMLDAELLAIGFLNLTNNSI